MLHLYILCICPYKINLRYWCSLYEVFFRKYSKFITAYYSWHIDLYNLILLFTMPPTFFVQKLLLMFFVLNDFVRNHFHTFPQNVSGVELVISNLSFLRISVGCLGNKYEVAPIFFFSDIDGHSDLLYKHLIWNFLYQIRDGSFSLWWFSDMCSKMLHDSNSSFCT